MSRTNTINAALVSTMIIRHNATGGTLGKITAGYTVGNSSGGVYTSSPGGAYGSAVSIDLLAADTVQQLLNKIEAAVGLQEGLQSANTLTTGSDVISFIN